MNCVLVQTSADSLVLRAGDPNRVGVCVNGGLPSFELEANKLLL